MQKNGSKNGETQTGQSRANPVDVAWLAGIFDGEGSVLARKVKYRNQTGPEKFSIGVDIRIGNTSISLLDKCQRIVQEICYKKYKLHKHAKGRNSVLWSLEVTKQRHAELVLEAMLPHLTSKRTQSVTMLSFLRSRKANRHWGQGYTPEEVEILTSLKAIRRAELIPTWEGVSTERSAPTPINGKDEATVSARSNTGNV